MYKKQFINKETHEIVDSYPMVDHEKYAPYYPPLKCPLCESEGVECKELGNRTYIYVCDECPFIGMEWYDKRDTENLVEYLNR